MGIFLYYFVYFYLDQIVYFYFSIINSIMESFFGRMKTEIYYGYEKNYMSFEEFSKAVDEYIDYYNNKRIQSKTKWMPPVQYRITSTCLN